MVVIAIPTKPITVTIHLCQIIFSFSKGIARSITNNGIEKLIIVAVTMGKVLNP
ncbi:hypothetical protein WALBB_550018 [Wolbachia pipientis wAlbB]|nr:hypothetical protein WALBB_550018 [Wolbachia pipientis wAlbB]